MRGLLLLLASVTLAQTDAVTLRPGKEVGKVRPLLGINIGPSASGEKGNADLEEAYREIGVRQVRTHDFYGPLDMATLFPDRMADPDQESSYDFEASDLVFRRIVDGGFEPYLRIGDSWNSAPGFPKAAPRMPPDFDRFARATVHVVRHYVGLASKGKQPLRFVEVWNEPDGRFWDGTRQEFYSLYGTIARAIKKAFPDLQVGGPGFTPAGALAPKGRGYVQGFLDAVKRDEAPLDFLSWHMYTNDPSDYDNAAEFYREELDKRGFQKTRMHVSEWNTEVRDGRDRNALALRTGGRGAAIMTAAWISMQEHDVALAHVYRGPDPSPNAPFFHGIFYADGRPKKTALAFSLWSRVATHETRLSVSGAPDGLRVLAAKDESGEIVLLLANPTDTPFAWRLAGPQPRHAHLAEVSDDEDHISERELPRAEATLQAYTVQLVTFRRE